MPRSSPEAVAAASWRQGGHHPQPPRHLGKQERQIWREIVECRAVDFFEPGSLHLLEEFCTAIVAQRGVAKVIAADPMNGEAAALFTKYGALTATLAQKLRLSIQSALRTESRKNEERLPASAPLLGGEAVWGDNSGKNRMN